MATCSLRRQRLNQYCQVINIHPRKTPDVNSICAIGSGRIFTSGSVHLIASVDADVVMPLVEIDGTEEPNLDGRLCR
jgi:hypothetical protein